METKTQLTWRGSIALMGFFAGLCTVFALVVTLAEGWVEHTQAGWPEATARIEKCGVDISVSRFLSYRIDCSVSYQVQGAMVLAHVYSRATSAPRRAIWHYPPNQLEKLQDWVNQHPPGTEIPVHYDSTRPAKAILVTTDMPLGGPRTPANLRLLGIAAVTCWLLLTLSRVTRPRSA